MIFINPLYVLSNVIYINSDSEYVLVSKRCWNTIVNLIFRKTKPSSQDLKKLKQLIYVTYVAYCNGQSPDHNAFNRKVGEMQMIDSDILDKVKNVVPVPSNIDTVELKIEDESFFLEDDYVEEVEDAHVEELTLINSRLTVLKSVEDDFDRLINYNLSRNDYFAKIVELAGFSRLRSLCKILTMQGNVKLASEFEEKFFVNNLESISKMLTFKEKDLPTARYIFTYCSECMSINSHKRMNLNPRNINAFINMCTGCIRYFNKYGEIFEYIVQDKYHDYEYKQSLCFNKNYVQFEFCSELLNFTKEIGFKEDYDISSLKEISLKEFRNLVESKILVDKLKLENSEKGIGYWDNKLNSPSLSNYYKYVAFKYVQDKNELFLSSLSYFREQVFTSSLFLENYSDNDFVKTTLNMGFLVNPKGYLGINPFTT